MIDERLPARPIDAYKEIIDQLVIETSHGGTEKWVAEGRVLPHPPERLDPNPFVQSLSIEQRQILASMLHHERTSAIHDVLAVLTWWVICREGGFTCRGEPMPGDLSDGGLHCDYVGRLTGWKWPREGSSVEK